jgi:hypothetical protein
MKSPIKFKVISREEIEAQIGVNSNWIDDYLKERPGILDADKIDIWCENSRSRTQTQNNFHLFKSVDVVDSETVYVFSIPLELFEFNQLYQEMYSCIDYFCNKYSENRIIFQWNHDNDWSHHGWFLYGYKNAWIVNFGYTSIKYDRNIIVPFWSINTTQIIEPKKYFATFIGSPNNQFRQDLVNCITSENNSNFLYLPNLSYEEFQTATSASIFTLCPGGGPGDGGFSWRFFECFHLNTIPVILVDRLIYPYEMEINYNDISLRFPRTPFLLHDIRRLEYFLEAQLDREIEMLENINKVRSKFTLGGVQMEIYNQLYRNIYG